MGGQAETNVQNDDVGMEGSTSSGASITLRSAGVSLAMVLCLGMLIWVKLRLVTNVPRTAYAEPDRRLVEPKKHPAPDTRAADATAPLPH
ncbi:MAG: hypothetical protein JSS51_14995 [Planctomycetes bacterium]|nr:hypothetical protein [Planctomycetota bacterium]